MNINEQMAIDAAGIQEAMARGEKVSKKDLKFLRSFLNINTRQAPNAGQRNTGTKKQKVN